MDQSGGDAKKPLQVRRQCAARCARTPGGDTSQDEAISPMLDLRVAITKRNAAGVVVIAGGGVHPAGVAGNLEKISVVDAVGIFIYEQPEIGGTRQRQIGRPSVDAILQARSIVSSGGAGGRVDP